MKSFYKTNDIKLQLPCPRWEPSRHKFSLALEGARKNRTQSNRTQRQINYESLGWAAPELWTADWYKLTCTIAGPTSEGGSPPPRRAFQGCFVLLWKYLVDRRGNSGILIGGEKVKLQECSVRVSVLKQDFNFGSLVHRNVVLSNFVNCSRYRLTIRTCQTFTILLAFNKPFPNVNLISTKNLQLVHPMLRRSAT